MPGPIDMEGSRLKIAQPIEIYVTPDLIETSAKVLIPAPLPYPRIGGGPGFQAQAVVLLNSGPPPARGYGDFLAKFATFAEVPT
ncbi:hypothetical protein ASE73_11985 [Sphingomonas sp. Leaf24]|nr:hypothetical protein ASE50_10035 [Sphingomonas sp. Leaf5]KQM85757.1 hypothetical protein ASE73_11985 [Sphingomonas sp. Leaf24]